MQVTRDKYELPPAVADTVQELSEMTGVKVQSIYTEIAHGYHGFVRVEYGRRRKNVNKQ